MGGVSMHVEIGGSAIVKGRGALWSNQLPGLGLGQEG
jgi:hypothetical protein